MGAIIAAYYKQKVDSINNNYRSVALLRQLRNITLQFHPSLKSYDSGKKWVGC